MEIPTGAAARRAWLALPRATRREVFRFARGRWPHPDPAVARVAVGWARRARIHAQRLLPLLFVPFLIQAAFPLDALPERYRHTALQVKGVVQLTVLAALVPYIALAVRQIRAARVEVVNLRALIAADRTPPRALTVHGTGRFSLPELFSGLYLLILVAMTVEWLALRRMAADEPPPEIPPGAERFVELEIALTAVFILFGVFTAFLVFVVAPAIVTLMLAHRPRGTGPAATVDADGLTLPHLRLALPWSEIREVDVASPAPRGRWSEAIGLWVVPRDPAVVVARSGLPRWRRTLLSCWLRAFYRSLYLPAAWLREPPEALVTAARGWQRAAVG